MIRKYMIILAAIALILPLSAKIFLMRNAGLDQQCISNLRLIQTGKDQWALEHFSQLDESTHAIVYDLSAHTNVAVTQKELGSYIIRGPEGPVENLSEKELAKRYPFPRCPRGGKYAIGRLGENPTCSFPHHILDSQNSQKKM